MHVCSIQVVCSEEFEWKKKLNKIAFRTFCFTYNLFIYEKTSLKIIFTIQPLDFQTRFLWFFYFYGQKEKEKNELLITGQK